MLSVGCSLAYQIATPTAAFAFNVLAAEDAYQRLVTETISCVPDVPQEIVVPAPGLRVLRCEVPAGGFELRYAATLEIARPAIPAGIKAENPARLPWDTLTHTLPSRYCENDRLTQIAWDLFGKTDDRVAQVNAICRWIDENMTYAPGTTDSRTSAWDVWQTRKGVCRDYTHLAIAFCRALSIPARYVGCYAAGLAPMDFHACFEAWLGGQWRLFDPTDNIVPEHIAIVSRGRDAATAALTTIFGKVTAVPVKVSCAVIPPAIAVAS